MVDPVASVERIVRVGLAIKEAADTPRRNAAACQEFRTRVLRFSAVLSQLQRAGAVDDSQAMGGALDDLEETLRRALELVTACQDRTNIVRRLLMAGDLARRLRAVKEDILNQVMLASFAINAHTTVLLLTMQTGGYLLPRMRQGWTAWEAGQIDEEFDPVVFKEPQLIKIRRHVQVGLLCVQQDRTERPTMADVLQMLSGKKEPPTPKKPMYAESYDKWIPPGNHSATYTGLHNEWVIHDSPSAWSEGSLSPR